jgi:hypothetical protein
MKPSITEMEIPACIMTALLMVGCGPSQEEIQAMIEASNTGLRQELIAANVVDSEEEKRRAAAAEAAKPNWWKSMEFLGSLNELMVNYEPMLTENTDSADLLACTTSYEFAVDPELKRRAKNLLKQQKASDKARSAKERTFEQAKWKQYQLDYAWNERVIAHPTLYACKFMGQWILPGSARYSSFNTKSKCDDGLYNDIKWAKYSQEREATSFYTGRPVSEQGAMSPPVLMTYIQENGITVPDRFHCLVADVERGTNDQAYIYCRGNRPSGTYIRVSGEMGLIHRGDSVSVPLKNSSHEAGGVLSKVDRKIGSNNQKVWMLDAIAHSVAQDEPSSCPTRDEILEGAANNSR